MIKPRMDAKFYVHNIYICITDTIFESSLTTIPRLKSIVVGLNRHYQNVRLIVPFLGKTYVRNKKALCVHVISFNFSLNALVLSIYSMLKIPVSKYKVGISKE